MEHLAIFDWMQDGIKTAILLVFITIVPCLLVGLAVAVIQAATHVQEQTLTFLPKVIVILLILMFGGPWMVQVLAQFTVNLFLSMPEIIHQ